MSGLQQNFFFALYPKVLIMKGIYYNKKLPHLSAALYKGNRIEDQTALIPTREQQLYHTFFFLQGKLAFSQAAQNCHQRRIVLYEKDQELGQFTLNIDQYASNYQDYNSKYYDEKVKLTESVDFEFELYMGSTSSELSDLLEEYRGESQLRTPLTSNLAHQESPESIIRNLKAVESELYSPTLSLPRKQPEEIDQESSVNSSIPVSSPPVLNSGFAISLTAVPVKACSSSLPKRSRRSLKEELRQFVSLPLKEQLLFWAFALGSVVTIYLSMLPIKKL